MDDHEFVNLVMKGVDAEIDKMCAAAGMMSLGELVAVLRGMPETAHVVFEDGTSPTGPHSYRGYYRFIAISKWSDKITAREFADMMDESIGKQFGGYKGGEFVMTRMTPVWVSSYGNSSGIGLVGVELRKDSEGQGVVVLIERKIE